MHKNTFYNRIFIIVLALVSAIAIGVSVWALFLREKAPVLAPDYAPQRTEENQTPVEGDDGEKLVTPDGGGAVSLTYSKEVGIDLSDKKAALLFANPGKSTQDMVLQIVIKDTVIVQSGRLTPGNQVTTLNLLDGADKLLAEGGYNGKFVVLYYNQQSGEKAMINTEIPINITVKD